MSDNRVAGFGKDPLAPSHGESLADQSFQSLKTKEIRDSMSPTELKFQSMALNNPSTTGWNVQSSSEVRPDGRGFRAETIATTDGVENINGGTAEFKGRNEQRSSAMHEGDDKNFVKQASESSNTHLQEKVVVGDENSGRTEVRMSSSTSTSSSKVIQSSSTTEDYGQPVEYHHPQYLMDSHRVPQRMQEPQYQPRPSQYEQQTAQDVRRSTDHSSTIQQQSEQYNHNRHETNTSQNVQTNERHEQNKRYVDVDKASPEYQQHVQYLMSQPGEIISNTVEYPKPNVKMITTVKRLPDGTIVRNKRYETEETAPTPRPSHENITRQTVTNNNTQRRDSQTSQQSKNYPGQVPSERIRRPNDDVVDNVERIHRDSVSNVETKYSTVKTSNRKFSTETTSETIQEYDDSHYPGSSRPKQVTNDFSTHGFPSVRPNKPTQEFASERPQTARPNQGYPSQNYTSPNPEALIPTRGEFEPVITERRIPTNDGEVIIVSSEKKRNVKQQTNSERIIETDIRTTDDDRRYQQISDVTTTTNRNQDFTTHGFPSVKEPQAQPSHYPDDWQVKPQAPTPGYPVGARPSPQNASYAPHAPNDDVVVVSSQKSHTSKHSSNTERIIETEILGEDGRPIPRQPAGVEYITTNYTVTTPGDQVPRQEFPGDARPTGGRDQPTTQGYPSVRSPSKTTPDFSTHGFPSARDTNKPSATPERLQTVPVKSQASPSPSPTPTKPKSTTIETTKRVIQKEKEVDSAHRAFAASLRSSSPVDSTRRDSYSTDGPRHTPRSSVSSTKNYRRDMREGSHDSAAGSETSRLSSTTVTRHTPPRTVGGRTVVTKQTELINVPSSPRGTKSPSPGKTITTTTTTTKTVTSKPAAPRDVPKSDNQHTTTTTNTTTTSSKNDTTFPINLDSLTITKKNISDNQAISKASNLDQQQSVVEEPCIKKHYYLLGPSDRSATATAPGKQEPSPRPSPAPNSRRSPYPSKSKSPLGDDEQSVKSHTSRPLSPTSSTSRSPKPIGSKDVPNSRDYPQPDQRQRPTQVVPVTSDERRPVDREATFEQIDKTSSSSPRRREPSPDTTTTATIYTTEDEVFITEQEDVDAMQNVKRRTKQLITHQKEPIPHRAPLKPSTVRTTIAPQEPHRIQTVVTRRTDRLEETKRPKPSDHTSPSTRQPSKPSNVTERRTPGSTKTVPTSTQDPKKPQSPSRPSDRIVVDKRPSIPKSGFPGRVHPSENDEKPFASQPIVGTRKPQQTTSDISKTRSPKPIDGERPYRRPQGGSPDRVHPSDTEEEPVSTNVREITVRTTNKHVKKTQQEIDELIEDDYTTRSKPQQPKSRSPQRPQQREPTVGTRKPQPRTGEVSPCKTTKTVDDEKPHRRPHGGSPDRAYPSDTEEEPTSTHVRETKSPQRLQPREPTGVTRKPQSPSQPRTGDVSKSRSPKPIDGERPYRRPQGGSPDRVHPSDTEEEPVSTNVREITVRTTNKHVKKTQQEIDELIEDDYTTRSKPQQPKSRSPQRPQQREPTVGTRKPQPRTGEVSPCKTTKTVDDEKPHRRPHGGSPDRAYPSDTEEEPTSTHVRETKSPQRLQPREPTGVTRKPQSPSQPRTGDVSKSRSPKPVDDEKPRRRPHGGSPDRAYPSDTEEEPTSINVCETSEITVRTTTKSPQRPQSREPTEGTRKPQAPSQPRTGDVSKPRSSKPVEDEKPRRRPYGGSPDRAYPSDTEEEPTSINLRETSEITVRKTTKSPQRPQSREPTEGTRKPQAPSQPRKGDITTGRSPKPVDDERPYRPHGGSPDRLYPSDTEEEPASTNVRETSAITIRTTNKNIKKTQQEIDELTEEDYTTRFKSQQPKSKSPQRPQPGEPTEGTRKPQSPSQPRTGDVSKSRSPKPVDDEKPHRRPQGGSPDRAYPSDTEEEPTSVNVRETNEITVRTTTKSPQRPQQKEPTEGARKPQSPLQPRTGDVSKSRSPKPVDDEKPHRRPYGGSPDRLYPSDTEEEPTSTNVRETSEITIRTTNKNVKKTQQEIDELTVDDYTARSKLQQPKSKSPERPQRKEPTEDQKKPQSPSQPRTGDIPTGRSPKTVDDEKPQRRPQGGSPDRAYPSDTEEVPTSTHVREITVRTTNKSVKKTQQEIDELTEDDYTRSQPLQPKSKSPQRPLQKEPTEGARKPQSPAQLRTGDVPTDGSPKPVDDERPNRRSHGGSPDRLYPSDTEEEPTSTNVRETSEITIRTTNKNVRKTQQEIDELIEDDYTTRSKPQQPKNFGSTSPKSKSPQRPQQREPTDYPDEQQRPKSYVPGSKKPTDYPSDEDSTFPSSQQSKGYRPEQREPNDNSQPKSMSPQPQTKTSWPGQRQPTDSSPIREISEITVKTSNKVQKETEELIRDDYTTRSKPQEPKKPDDGFPDDREPSTRSPQKQPKSSGPEPRDYPSGRQPSPATSQQPKGQRPEDGEPTGYPTSRLPDRHPENYKPGAKEPKTVEYPDDREPTTRSPQKQPKSSGSETRDYPKGQRPEDGEPTGYPTSRSPDRHPENYKPGAKEPKTAEYPDDREPTTRSPQKQPKSSGPEPNDYPSGRQPSPGPTQQPKGQRPEVGEPTGYPTSRSPDRHPDNYKPGDKEPKTDEYPEHNEPTQKVSPQQPKKYAPGPKEPKPVDYSDDKEKELFMTSTKRYVKTDDTKDITQKNITTTIHEQFIDAERTKQPELPDGAFISKSPEEPSTSPYPTYKKKGVSRRDTFEDRCRQILGMETYGDTPGAFKKRPTDDVEPLEEDEKTVKTKTEKIQKSTFEVKIEDCADDDDDEPLSINSVKKTLGVRKTPTSDDEVPHEEVPKKPTKKVEESYGKTTENVYVDISKKRYPETTSDSEPETVRPKDTSYETIEVTKQRTVKSDTATKKPTSRSPTRSVSPMFETPKDTLYETIEVTSTRVDKSGTEFREKPSSRSPTRSVSPMYRTPKDTEYETVEVTEDVDIRKKPTSRSPSKPGQPTDETFDVTKQPTSRYPSKPGQPTYETFGVTEKPTSKSPTRPGQPTYETFDVTKKPTSKSPTRPGQPSYETFDVTKKPTSKSPTRPGQPTDETFDVTKKPTSKSPTRPGQPTDETFDVTKKPTSKSPTRPGQPAYETFDITKKPTSKSPTRPGQPGYETFDVTKKPTSKSPTRPGQPSYETFDVTIKPTSKSPTRPGQPGYETFDITKKPTSKSPTRPGEPAYEIFDVTKKPTSKSPTRSGQPTDETFDVTKKPASKSPTRPGQPSYETFDVTKKPTSKSPTRPGQPGYETFDITKKPTSKSPTRPGQPGYETFDVTKKPTSKSPTRPGQPAYETFDVTKKPKSKSPTRDESPTYRSPKETSYETIEVTKKRIEKSDVDVTKRTTSKSPTRQQPVKTDSSKKPTAKKPSDDGPRKEPADVRKQPMKKKPTEDESFIRTTETIWISVTESGSSDATSESEPETIRPKGTTHQTVEVTKRRVQKDTDITKRPTAKSPTKSGSPSFDTPKRKSSKPTEVTSKTTTSKKTVKDDRVTETGSIKDRLRPSVRKDKSPKKPDQVDAGSSPETSPTRHTERRRSSNISVNTEIIIDHTETESVGKKPHDSPRKPKDSVFREIIDSTVMPEKMPRKMPVTERKESAPVHRVTHKDKDTKMSRSTSEKLIKVVKKPETTTTTTTTTTTSKTTLTPPTGKVTPKPSADHRRPNKCFATKTINLSTTDRLMSSEDMENVIIDIQHAKSSREPSPDKIVPTPVPAHFDTGKPRYPDVVQEPEDEPRKKPVVKNIPIFEEEHNTYVGCHITEVNQDKLRKTTYDRSDYREDDVLSTPLVEAPPSLDYPTSDKSYPASIPVPDDECLLSVHDKVSKFQHIAEEVKKPKVSTPFNREFDDTARVPDDDECLLTVDEKVDKFIRTAESLTNQPLVPTPTRDIRRPFPDETDEDLMTTECTYTTVKLAPTAPQKSPELVRHISRHISRQSDGGEPIEPTEPIDSTTIKHTYNTLEEYEINKSTDEEFVTHRQTSAVKQPKQRRPIVPGEVEDDDDEELVPHTPTHTTRIEQRRQKDILTRPSVFDNNNKQPVNKVNKTQPKYVSSSSPVAPKGSEKPRQLTQSQPQSQQRPQVKPRAKPEPLNEKTVTTTTITTSKRQQPTPQRRVGGVDTDFDHRRGSSSSNVVSSSVVSSTTHRQTTKPTPTTQHSTNGPKKSPHTPTTATAHKKPDSRQTPLHTNKTKNLKHVVDVDGDDDDGDVGDYVVEYDEFQVEVVPNDSETELIINSDTARRSTTTKTTKTTTTGTGKISVRKEPTPQHTSSSPATRKMKEIPKGYTTSSSPSSPQTNRNTKAHVVNLTDRSTVKHNTTTSTTKPTDRFETNHESFPDSSRPPKKVTPYPQKTNKTSVTTTDSVAARRSLFENHLNSPSSRPASVRVTPTGSPSSGRRPSYMDHTKSSLEHIRRDSLELNKTNYTRKPSGSYDDDSHSVDRNSQVKFEVPRKLQQDLLNPDSEEHIDIEEIFELEILERLLETVTSYELRRRIRAQIRLVKKNLLNVEHNTQNVMTTSTTRKTSHRDRSISPETQTKTQVTTKKHYVYKEEQHEEERRSSSTHTSPERTKVIVTKITRTHSPEANRKPTSPSYERGHSPQQVRLCSKPEHGRSPSPESKVEHKEFSVRESTTKKHYVYRDDDDEEQVERVETIYKETSPTPGRTSRKSVSSHSSPERHQVDNTKSPRPTDRSTSPHEKKPSQTRVYSKSPENKVPKSDAIYEQTVTTVKQQKRPAPSVQTPKTKQEQKAPVWADRKNILKTPSTTTSPRKPSSVTDSRTSSLARTVKSSTNQSQKHTTTNKSSYVEDDCITSSYGIGPTDENGLPLFGIRALKKKKPTSEPSETTEEVTGYVVEEKYYSDNKSKPIVERKELIYSTNPDELSAIKDKVKETSVRSIKTYGTEDIEEPHSNNNKYKITQKTSTSVRSSPEEFLESSTTKYVRRGSVKEMSEKFIHKESSSMVSEKSNNYPKAGLILRTNSRKHSRDSDNMDGDNIEYYETITHQHRGDSEEEDVCLVGEGDLVMVESESESESIKKTQREFKKITSTKSSSSRSFLNTKGEQKVVTSVDDVLDRMRNADNVVEEGDTAEDQEARALLNKFLGASIIMKGVESAMPMNRETKMITTTTTGSGRQPAKHEVKTTRVTKTIKSGSSSSPVIETTCDIEEIWDEEILKQLLEQARTYEERRKIRSRLRELMAERSEKNNCQQTGKEEDAVAAAGTTTSTSAAEQSNVQRSDSSSASEYEEIIEEVTDYSDDAQEEEETAPKSAAKETDSSAQKVTEENTTNKANESSPAQSSESVTEQLNSSKKDSPATTPTAADSNSVDATEKETVETPGDVTDSSEKGESAMPTMHEQKMLQANQATNNSQRLGISSSTYSKTATTTNSTATGGNNAMKASSDRSMHAPPNNKSSSTSAPSYASQNPPIVTVTAGRTDNNTSFRDVGNSLDVGVGNSSRQRQVDRLGVPQKEDSGTESGEDLRLIAAGLRDQLQMKSDSNIIDDVTCALSRLENSLKEGKDITVDTEKRKALLALVGRLQAGLTSPEKLAEIAAAMSELDGNNDGLYGESSSPEADAHRSGRQRFAKRRNRIDRHTVGVSREELADARRYMEDMLMLENASHSITPEATNNNSPPQWFPLEKNASSGAILIQQSAKPNMYHPESITNNQLSPNTNGKRRPLSGDFSVSFGMEPTSILKQTTVTPPSSFQGQPAPVDNRNSETGSPDSTSKFSRFSNKKLLMKRANTIDIAKTKKFNSDLDTDSDAEDKGQLIGLKRAIHPTVKKRVQNVVPPFEPKTENDRKFLAFINKQSDKPGLGWTNNRSVSNWTSKFGSLKHSFEVGGSTVTAAKPPQVPGHIHVKSQPSNRQPPPPRDPTYLSTNQQIAQRLQQEAERQAEERRRKLEYERLEYEHRERERLEYEHRERERQEQLRLQQQRERLERERLEREYYENEIRERNQRAAAQQSTNGVPKPIPINEFKHAPQSVFRPIDNGETQPKGIYKPIPQLPTVGHSWQAPSNASRTHPSSPNNYGHARPDNSFITSPPPSSKSPIGLPWASKPAVDSSSFKNKANRFEERSRFDNYTNGAMLQRHNSLRASNINVSHNDDFKKRPSLPNTVDPYSVSQEYQPNNSFAYAPPPPPTNISFTYNNRPSKPTYLSYPCLPTAVSEYDNFRSREDSLTNPQAVPLVLTSANPTYCPPQPAPSQQQQQQYLSRDTVQPFDIMSPTDSAITSPSVATMMQTDCTDDDLDSDNLCEYRAVSKVMGKPQSQTAVTVGRRTGHVSDDEVYGKNSKAAKNLLTTMKNIGNNENKRQTRNAKRPEAPTSPKVCLSPDGRSYQAPLVEPIFPDLNKFEPNRKPLYDGQPKPQVTPAAYSQNALYGQPRKQPTMYKSLENIAKRIPPQQQTTNLNNPNMFMPRHPSPKPYISETQTAYVVTYPTDDTTDDEEHSRYSSYSQQSVADNQLLKRTRNISETSTGSSNTTSTTYAHNLPSPNTNWTSNPITTNDHSNSQPLGQNYYEPTTNYSSHQPVMPTEPKSAMARGEEPRVLPSMPAPYQYSQPPTTAAQYTNTIPTPYTDSQYAQVPQGPQTTTTNFNGSLQYTKPTSAKSYDSPTTPTSKYDSYRPTQPQTVVAPKQTSASAPKQQQVPQTPKPQQTRTAAVQKSTDYKSPPITTQTQQPQANVVTTTKKVKQTSTTQTSVKSQEKATNKKSALNMRKAVSEDHEDNRKTVSTVREQNTSVLKESGGTKVVQQQQSERITTDTRRKSLGTGNLSYQQTEERRIETQQYKSSAPLDTPDIVKSSLPKDENQPILKKFGPPQRHHYMPNAYQSPLAKTGSSPAATPGAATASVHTKRVEVTASKSILKSSQQTTMASKPTVVETPATPQPEDDYIPRNIVYNNIHAFTSLSRRQGDERSHNEPVVRPNKLSKSDSWNQIINLQNQHMPSPTHKFAPSPVNELRRTKSGHSLAIPKMYEAGIDKTEVTEKQKTVAAYFSGQKSPIHQEQTVIEQTKRSVINRTKTSEKISASRKSMGSQMAVNKGGLTRSATMPHIANLSFLDESNVEDAFEQLMMDAKQQQSSTSTTEKTETKGRDGAVVTTTTKVTTRTVSGGTGPKTVSPFTKFKQLDRQNSQQSAKSPTTPTTPGGGGSTATPSATGKAPLFKFTDPALNARAATVKEQLLQWCQSKTKEYENVQITNFSACWVDGLAFCALIHHFLPDAFDYSQLTPENRRKNFELAFTVADEKAGIAPLLDVEDMVVMKRPDWKCVFVYVQSIYRRFRNCQ